MLTLINDAFLTPVVAASRFLDPRQICSGGPGASCVSCPVVDEDPTRIADLCTVVQLGAAEFVRDAAKAMRNATSAHCTCAI